MPCCRGTASISARTRRCSSTREFNGVAQPGWVAVNRVTNSVAPSQILGNLTADGTVVVLNQSGIIFGRNRSKRTRIRCSPRRPSLGMRPGPCRAVAERPRPRPFWNVIAAFLANGLFTPANGTTGRTNAGFVRPLLVSGMTQGDGTTFLDMPEGGIVVDHGARITGGAGGFVMLTAPDIDSGGVLTAVDGQVSLQAGRAINCEQSTGADSDPDPYVRGYKLNSFVFSGVGEGVGPGVDGRDGGLEAVRTKNPLSTRRGPAPPDPGG